MQVSAGEFNLILAALRAQAMIYEQHAKDLGAKGETREAFKLGAFARACGDLSDKLEKQYPRIGARLNS